MTLHKISIKTLHIKQVSFSFLHMNFLCFGHAHYAPETIKTKLSLKFLLTFLLLLLEEVGELLPLLLDLVGLSSQNTTQVI